MKSNTKILLISSLLFVAILIGVLPVLFLHDQFDFLPILFAQQNDTKRGNDKVVILNFDDNRKSQYTDAKPILDKYGFKATFYVICNYAENKKGYMNWTEIETLQKEGHDIASHTMNHKHLGDLSKKDVKFEVGQSKKCLQEHGINATSFAYPFNNGPNIKSVVKVVAKYYDLARTASSPLTFLRCDGWKERSSQTDCRTYTSKGTLTYANRYSIRGWSHDLSRLVNSYNDSQLFDRFIDVVNNQSKYNKNGIIKAIPIIIYHRAGDRGGSYITDLDLFDKEMKYLHDNNIRVLTMSDLGYDEKSKYLYIKQSQESKVQ